MKKYFFCKTRIRPLEVTTADAEGAEFTDPTRFDRRSAAHSFPSGAGVYEVVIRGFVSAWDLEFGPQRTWMAESGKRAAVKG